MNVPRRNRLQPGPEAHTSLTEQHGVQQGGRSQHNQQGPPGQRQQQLEVDKKNNSNKHHNINMAAGGTEDLPRIETRQQQSSSNGDSGSPTNDEPCSPRSQPGSAQKKRRKQGNGGGLTARHASCKVIGCTADLRLSPRTHMRFRLCGTHIRAPVVLVDGVESRFCQQCSRFHVLEEFEGLNRTCRSMLVKNRLRQRRKRHISHSASPQPRQKIIPRRGTLGSAGAARAASGRAARRRRGRSSDSDSGEDDDTSTDTSDISGSSGTQTASGSGSGAKRHGSGRERGRGAEVPIGSGGHPANGTHDLRAPDSETGLGGNVPGGQRSGVAAGGPVGLFGSWGLQLQGPMAGDLAADGLQALASNWQGDDGGSLASLGGLPPWALDGKTNALGGPGSNGGSAASGGPHSLSGMGVMEGATLEAAPLGNPRLLQGMTPPFGILGRQSWALGSDMGEKWEALFGDRLGVRGHSGAVGATHSGNSNSSDPASMVAAAGSGPPSSQGHGHGEHRGVGGLGPGGLARMGSLLAHAQQLVPSTTSTSSSSLYSLVMAQPAGPAAGLQHQGGGGLRRHASDQALSSLDGSGGGGGGGGGKPLSLWRCGEDAVMAGALEYLQGSGGGAAENGHGAPQSAPQLLQTHTYGGSSGNHALEHEAALISQQHLISLLVQQQQQQHHWPGGGAGQRRAMDGADNAMTAVWLRQHLLQAGGPAAATRTSMELACHWQADDAPAASGAALLQHATAGTLPASAGGRPGRATPPNHYIKPESPQDYHQPTGPMQQRGSGPGSGQQQPRRITLALNQPMGGELVDVPMAAAPAGRLLAHGSMAPLMLRQPASAANPSDLRQLRHQLGLQDLQRLYMEQVAAGAGADGRERGPALNHYGQRGPEASGGSYDEMVWRGSGGHDNGRV